MALVPCPTCHREVSEAAPNCFACGAPMSVAVTTHTPPIAFSPMAPRSPLACPQCFSEDTRRVSLVVAEGTGHTSGMSIGGVGRDAAVLATQGKTQSVLAAALAPPRPRSYGGAVLAAIIAAFFAGLVASQWLVAQAVFYIGVATLAVVFWLASREDRRWNDERLPIALGEWERKMLCRRCGAVFIPAASPFR